MAESGLRMGIKNMINFHTKTVTCIVLSYLMLLLSSCLDPRSEDLVKNDQILGQWLHENSDEYIQLTFDVSPSGSYDVNMNSGNSHESYLGSWGYAITANQLNFFDDNDVIIAKYELVDFSKNKMVLKNDSKENLVFDLMWTPETLGNLQKK
jgi:hypothetical protein